MRQTQFPNLREDYTSPLVPPIRVGFAGRNHDSKIAMNVAYLRYAVVFETKERFREETKGEIAPGKALLIYLAFLLSISFKIFASSKNLVRKDFK